MFRVRLSLVGLLAAAAPSGAPMLARADDFYDGKTAVIVVGFSPGGGFDA